MRGVRLIGGVVAAAVVAVSAAPALAKPGDLIVADSTNSKIVRINPANGHKSTIASGHGIVDPAGMTFGPNGKLFVADYGAFGGNGAVFKVNPRTHAVSTLSGDLPLKQPVYVDYNPDGSLYAPDFEVPALFRLSPVNGNPTPLGGASGAVGAFGIEVDHDGSLVVSDIAGGRLFRVDRKTGAAHKIGSGTPFDSPYGIDIDPKGRILVADEATVPEVDRVSSNGKHVRVLARKHKLTDATQPAVAPSGKVFVAAGDAGVISVDPKTGKQEKIAGAGDGYFEGIEVEPPKCAGAVANIVGSNKPDHLKGSKFPDVIAGMGGRDVIKGLKGDDRLCGDKGSDKLIGGKGHDRVVGGPGHDIRHP